MFHTDTDQSNYPTHAEPSGVRVLMLGYRGCVYMTCAARQEARRSTLVCIWNRRLICWGMRVWRRLAVIVYGLCDQQAPTLSLIHI